MSVQTTLNEIATVYSNLGSGQPDERLKAVLYQQLAARFSQLAVDLAAMPGWSAATGTASRATFDTTTATTAVLAQHMKALQDDLTTRGVIGP